MECRFLQHGLAISYDHVVKPCCDWRYDQDWSAAHDLAKVDLVNWHQSDIMQIMRADLAQGRWPEECGRCQETEQSGRHDSTRGNGNHAYRDYGQEDITLEIRPGSTCNFACQTCWPEASSRVAQYHDRAGLINMQQIDSTSIDSYDWLMPVRHRIKDMVLLGGEPFYDKACRKFLAWALDHSQARLTMFTNASGIDFDWVERYQRPLCLVVSLDAMGRPAEYIRYGTDWQQIWANYQRLKAYDHVELRVNITLSIYNYFYVSDLIHLLGQDWPDCVTFGHPRQSWMNEWALPDASRAPVIERLDRAIAMIDQSEIETGQRSNAMNALGSVRQNLHSQRSCRASDLALFQDFYQRMDRVKGIHMRDYCPELSRAIEQPSG